MAGMSLLSHCEFISIYYVLRDKNARTTRRRFTLSLSLCETNETELEFNETADFTSVSKEVSYWSLI